MVIGTATIKLNINYAKSLKDKRSVVKSIISKAQNKFNISIAESDCVDMIRTTIISFVFIAANTAISDSMIENIVSFIELNTDAEVILLHHENIMQ